MPPLPSVPYSPPSTLADVLGQIVDNFAAAGDPTPILIGKAYEAFGVGSAPRVLLAPEPRGKIGPPIEQGNVCSVTHSCNVLVRGLEDGSDLGRFTSAYALGDRLLSAIRRAASGRLEFGDFTDASPTDVDAYGAELAFSFTYQRDVKWDGAIRGLPAAAADPSPPQPVQPPGTAAISVAIDATTNPQGVTS